MTIELTTEEIVTRLLTSNEILKRNKDNFYMSNPSSLGNYLKNLPHENLPHESLPPENTKLEPSVFTKDSKYCFIKM